jgi:hypothetical protein
VGDGWEPSGEVAAGEGRHWKADEPVRT